MKRILPLILAAFAVACSGPDYRDTEAPDDAALAFHDGAATAQALASGTLSANPTTVRINLDRTSTGTTNVCWNVANASTGEVWLRLNGQPEELFARGPGACQFATWITAGNVFEFRLYAEWRTPPCSTPLPSLARATTVVRARCAAPVRRATRASAATAFAAQWRAVPVMPT
ncbi:hypothetical protein G4177_15865 [Corallococcus sp. ZKHCc1 1396]|uniref:Uncharacterized protein n=1 Tax=Corallococcus soli TaxID=2710757 RepID=A0ABR9PNZ6_9BACT|nr:hypothetical protein [Corallococcus soli]MBE4749640.1 hypothetical protein [Corallococcus soli]